jgi:hypothetical protein
MPFRTYWLPRGGGEFHHSWLSHMRRRSRLNLSPKTTRYPRPAIGLGVPEGGGREATDTERSWRDSRSLSARMGSAPLDTSRPRGPCTSMDPTAAGARKSDAAAMMHVATKALGCLSTGRPTVRAAPGSNGNRSLWCARGNLSFGGPSTSGLIQSRVASATNAGASPAPVARRPPEGSQEIYKIG